MLRAMDGIILKCQSRLRGYLTDFKREEKGASDIVAIMVIIVVVIAIAAIFQEQLTKAVTAVFDKLTGFINKTS